MIIGLCGYARAGKDTAAEGLVSVGYQRMAFADELKRVAREIDPIVWDRVEREYINASQERSEDSLKATTNYRDFLVKLGRGMRSVDPDIWVRPVIKAAKEASSNVVITDVRYPNEVHHIARSGGKVIYVGRPSVGPANEEERASIDEIFESFLGIGYLVNNKGIEELRARAIEWAEVYE